MQVWTPTEEGKESQKSGVAEEEETDKSIEDTKNTDGVWLRCADGSLIFLERRYCAISDPLRSTLGVVDLTRASTKLTSITPNVVQQVVAYLQRYEAEGEPTFRIPKPLVSKDIVLLLPEDLKHEGVWMQNLPKDDLFMIINCAHALKLDFLVYLGCAQVASMIKGVPISGIRAILRPDGQ